MTFNRLDCARTIANLFHCLFIHCHPLHGSNHLILKKKKKNIVETRVIWMHMHFICSGTCRCSSPIFAVRSLNCNYVSHQLSLNELHTYKTREGNRKKSKYLSDRENELNRKELFNSTINSLLPFYLHTLT